MKVLFFAYIRDYTGAKEVYVEHHPTLKQLLLRLCEMYGNKFKNKIFSDDELSDEIIILVNGRNVVHLNNLETFLNPEDEICIFPVVAGG